MNSNMESNRLPATLCTIILPNEFYIRLIKPNSLSRKKLQQYSERVAQNHAKLRFEDPEDELEVGQLVYVKHDQEWSRAKIIALNRPRHKGIFIRVLLIDKGKFASVFDCNRHVVDLPDKNCTKIPPQSKKLRLEGNLKYLVHSFTHISFQA